MGQTTRALANCRHGRTYCACPGPTAGPAPTEGEGYGRFPTHRHLGVARAGQRPLLVDEHGLAVSRRATRQLAACVAVIVPHANEADLLPETLPSLLGQDYPGEARVVLVDDVSTDGTAEVAAATSKNSGGLALYVLRGLPRPPGWAGKPWAMAQGPPRA